MSVPPGGTEDAEDGHYSGALTEDAVARAGGGPGLAALCGGLAPIVRLDRPFLTGDAPLPELPDRSLVLVDAAWGADPAVVEGCRTLVDAGLCLVVEQPPPPGRESALVDLAEYVRLDMPVHLQTSTLSRAATFREAEEWIASGKKILAAGIETMTDLKESATHGCHLFEGRMLSRPLVPIGEGLTPSRLACLRMIEKVNDPSTSAPDLERLVETDPGLSYRLLHISGLGSNGGLRRPVNSIREAVVMLGRDWIHRWITLMFVADASQGSRDQLVIAMTRARMCELMAEELNSDRAAAFTVGMLSALEILLAVPVTELVSRLAVTDELKSALLGREGRLGSLLGDALDWQDWEIDAPLGPVASGLESASLERAYLSAVDWAETSVTALFD